MPPPRRRYSPLIRRHATPLSDAALSFAAYADAITLFCARGSDGGARRCAPRRLRRCRFATPIDRDADYAQQICARAQCEAGARECMRGGAVQVQRRARERAAHVKGKRMRCAKMRARARTMPPAATLIRSPSPFSASPSTSGYATPYAPFICATSQYGSEETFTLYARRRWCTQCGAGQCARCQQRHIADRDAQV
jgi:hypothetical protein